MQFSQAVVKYLKTTICILIFISFGFKCADNNCDFENGKYKIVYEKEFANYPKFEFVINGQSLTEINSDSNRKYTIEKLGENSFRLKLLEKQTDSLTDF